MYAVEGARHGAARAVEVAQAATGTEAAGQEAAMRFLDQVGGLSVDDVSVDRGAGEVTVSVSGSSLALIPFWSPGIEVESSGPVEQWSGP